LREYVPYAAACAAIADGLRARNKVLPRDPFRWEGVLGGRGAGIAAGVDGGFAVELAFVLFTDALLKVHVVLAPEGRTALDGADPTALMAAGRELQAAAGVFRYIADEAVPRALAALSTPPPPELDAHVNAALAALCLAVAQCLVVRNAELSSYPPSTLVKLSLGAHALCTRAAEAADACAPLLSPLVAATGRDLAAFMQGWSQRLLAVNAHEEGRLGEKTGRVRAALRCMSELAASGGAVGALAADRSAQYAETMREYEEDVRREIVRELPEDELGMSRMETKVIVQEVKYSLPVAEVVKKKPKA
jgi:BRO1-like domain